MKLFVGKREKEAISLLDGMCSLISQMMIYCDELLRAFFLEGDLKKAECLGKKITQTESEADEKRREFIRRLYEGAFLPSFRSELVEIAERLDKVADAIEECSHTVLLRDILLKRLGRQRAKLIGNKLSAISQTSTEAVKALIESLRFVHANMEKSLEKIKDVEELEHKSDLLESELKAELSRFERVIDPLSIIQLEEVIRKLGSISDAAEDTGDAILRLISGFRG